MSPRWGFKTFGHPVCYKHVAPLGLKTGNTCPLYICRTFGAKNWKQPAIIHIALRWGERRAVTLLYAAKICV